MLSARQKTGQPANLPGKLRTAAAGKEQVLAMSCHLTAKHPQTLPNLRATYLGGFIPGVTPVKLHVQPRKIPPKPPGDDLQPPNGIHCVLPLCVELQAASRIRPSAQVLPRQIKSAWVKLDCQTHKSNQRVLTALSVGTLGDFKGRRYVTTYSHAPLTVSQVIFKKTTSNLNVTCVGDAKVVEITAS